MAYQTSGSIAVFDDDALRFVDFARQLADALGDARLGDGNGGGGEGVRGGKRADGLGNVGEDEWEELGGRGAGGVAPSASDASLARAASAAKRVTGGIYDKIRSFLETKRPGQVGRGFPFSVALLHTRGARGGRWLHGMLCVSKSLHRTSRATINPLPPKPQVDLPEVLQVKGMIRLGEARAACRYLGIKDDNVHFLNMPFYDTGGSGDAWAAGWGKQTVAWLSGLIGVDRLHHSTKQLKDQQPTDPNRPNRPGMVRKKPLSEADIALVYDLMESIQPHMVFAAGDLSGAHAWPGMGLHGPAWACMALSPLTTPCMQA